jgi:glycosyltransferase involved in cell wall biosynthesis
VRICFVAPQAFPIFQDRSEIDLIGGAELQQVLAARALASRGADVSMICCDYGQDQEVTIDGVRILRAYRPQAGFPILRFVWPRLTSIWNCMRQADAEIYYQRAAGMLTGVVAKYCRVHDRKSVFAAAGNPDMLRHTPRIRYARDRWIYEYGLRTVDAIVVQNDIQAQLCHENFGRKPTKLLNMYDRPSRSEIQVGSRILWVSTIRSLKRPHLFLDLAERLPRCNFRMIGGPGHGEHDLYSSVSSRARSLPNLEFLGFVPLPATERYFDAASVFVNTSESEGFPNTFLQAWSRGVPSVSFVDAGARMGAQRVGVVVEDFGKLAEAVAKLVEDQNARLEEGSRSQQYYSRFHSVGKVVPGYEELFARLLAPG